MKLKSSIIEVKTLLLDAMYYQAAKNNFKIAKRYYGNIQEKLEKVDKYLADLADLKKNKKTINSKKLESKNNLLEKLSHAQDELDISFGPYIQAFTSVHIFCVASLESHINFKARFHLKGKFFKEFDRLTLRGKWLFLPKILGNKTFKLGSEPFQSFVNLIKIRDKLVHFKGKPEEKFIFGSPIKMFADLGIWSKPAQKSISTVESMITELANLLDEDKPHWLFNSDVSFFKLIYH